MKIPSRRMPPRSVPPTAWYWFGLLLTAAFMGIMVYVAIVNNGVSRWLMIGFIAFVVMAFVRSHIRARRMLALRADEDICTFARALPAKSHDTWVVRAVYEEFCFHVGRPVRPEDKLGPDLDVVDDLEIADLISRIGERAGRSMENLEKNPMFDKVNTVEDVVLFFER